MRLCSFKHSVIQGNNEQVPLKWRVTCNHRAVCLSLANDVEHVRTVSRGKTEAFFLIACCFFSPVSFNWQLNIQLICNSKCVYKGNLMPNNLHNGCGKSQKCLYWAFLQKTHIFCVLLLPKPNHRKKSGLQTWCLVSKSSTLYAPPSTPSTPSSCLWLQCGT